MFCRPPASIDRDRRSVGRLSTLGETPVVLDPRSLVLSEAAALVGGNWARAVHAAVCLEGRPASGGWPGTLGEARARVAPHLRTELARLGMPALSGDEITTTAREAYRKAKRAWLDLQW